MHRNLNIERLELVKDVADNLPENMQFTIAEYLPIVDKRNVEEISELLHNIMPDDTPNSQLANFNELNNIYNMLNPKNELIYKIAVNYFESTKMSVSNYFIPSNFYYKFLNENQSYLFFVGDPHNSSTKSIKDLVANFQNAHDEANKSPYPRMIKALLVKQFFRNLDARIDGFNPLKSHDMQTLIDLKLLRKIVEINLENNAPSISTINDEQIKSNMPSILENIWDDNIYILKSSIKNFNPKKALEFIHMRNLTDNQIKIAELYEFYKFESRKVEIPLNAARALKQFQTIAIENKVKINDKDYDKIMEQVDEILAADKIHHFDQEGEHFFKLLQPKTADVNANSIKESKEEEEFTFIEKPTLELSEETLTDNKKFEDELNRLLELKNKSNERFIHEDIYSKLYRFYKNSFNSNNKDLNQTIELISRALKHPIFKTEFKIASIFEKKVSTPKTQLEDLLKHVQDKQRNLSKKI